MTKLTLRKTKNEPLTYDELDANFLYPFSNATYFEIAGGDTTTASLGVNIQTSMYKVCMYPYRDAGDGNKIIASDKIEVIPSAPTDAIAVPAFPILGYILHDESIDVEASANTTTKRTTVPKGVSAELKYTSTGDCTSVKMKLCKSWELTNMLSFTLSSLWFRAQVVKTFWGLEILSLVKNPKINECRFTFENNIVYITLEFANKMTDFELLLSLSSDKQFYFTKQDTVMEILS